MIYGRIILRIITEEYIAYYHIAELYAHASIVSTYVGLEICVKYIGPTCECPCQPSVIRTESPSFWHR